jgi:ADP-glucose pyrophosphorylase
VKDVVAVVLGGGRGTRLYPLTQWRSKPAVPLAGKYRLVDVPISNCINSGLRHIFVLSQFQSASLNRHVARTYRFDPFTPGFVEILAAEQTESSMDWYQGTADAVRKQLHRFLRHGVEHILILSGDQLYVMDFAQVLKQHTETGADITIAVTPVSERDAASSAFCRSTALLALSILWKSLVTRKCCAGLHWARTNCVGESCLGPSLSCLHGHLRIQAPGDR